MFMYFNLEISGEEIKVKVAMRETWSEVRFSEILLLLHFSEYYLFIIIKIPSISRIQILRHIPFFKLTSEYLEYILEKEYLGTNWTEILQRFQKDRF
jgi:hypothetical protein